MSNNRHSHRRVTAVEEDDFSTEKNNARPALAAWLLIAPITACISLLAWSRLFWSVRQPIAEELQLSDWLINSALLIFFTIPHSWLARGSGRRLLNRISSPEAERPIYVLISGVTLLALAFGWQTGGALLWNHEGVWLIICRVVQASGLLLASWAALVSGGGHLLGLPQLKAMEKGLSAPSQEFVALPPYRWTRQPINLGVMLFMLGAPQVTGDRLFLLVGTVAWILLATPYEERDCEVSFGSAYLEYRSKTPRWLPRIFNSKS